MGGVVSQYKITSERSNVTPPDWLHAPNIRVLPITEANFGRVKVLGKGKFGTAFLAKNQQAKMTTYVVLKYMAKQTIFDFQSAGKAKQEVHALETADHPFIIHCFGGFETQTCYALVLEYAFGGELYHRMKQVHKMGENEAKFYFCEIASALNYLHNELGIVYRDLKPENVLLDLEGHVRLCDFGFATVIAFGEDPVPLTDGCGTVMYMAPELVGTQTSIHGFPVDWWALGAVLAEMLAGEAPFGNSEHDNKFEIFNSILEKAPQLPLMMGFKVRQVIKGLLNKSDKKRFAWEEVQSCSWLRNFPWDDLEHRRIRPPFVPTVTGEPSSANFISWDDIPLPTTLPSSNVLSYCKDIKMPAGKASMMSYGSHTVGRDSLLGGASAGARGRQPGKKGAVTPGVEGDPGTPPPMRREKSKLEGARDSVKLTKNVSRLDPSALAAASPSKLSREKSKLGGANATGGQHGMLKREKSKLETSRDSMKMTRDGIDSKEMASAAAGIGGKTGDSVKLTRERSISNLNSDKRAATSPKHNSQHSIAE